MHRIWVYHVKDSTNETFRDAKPYHCILILLEPQSFSSISKVKLVCLTAVPLLNVASMNSKTVRFVLTNEEINAVYIRQDPAGFCHELLDQLHSFSAQLTENEKVEMSLR